jgi:hypothetical protein
MTEKRAKKKYNTDKIIYRLGVKNSDIIKEFIDDDHFITKGLLFAFAGFLYFPRTKVYRLKVPKEIRIEELKNNPIVAKAVDIINTEIGTFKSEDRKINKTLIKDNLNIIKKVATDWREKTIKEIEDNFKEYKKQKRDISKTRAYIQCPRK